MGQWQCSTVANNYNYVGCVNGACECKKNYGFAGEATAESKCDCPSTKNVYWQGGNPYCLSFDDAITSQLQKEREELLKSKVMTIYEDFKWPNAATFAGKIAAGDFTGPYFEIFDANVTGRIDPAGELVGMEGASEYFVGQVWTGSVRVYDIFFDKLVASGNKVCVNADIQFAQYVTPVSPTPYAYWNLTQTGCFTFNDQNKIIFLNLINRNVQLSVEPIGTGVDNYANRQRACGIIFAANCNSVYDPAGYYTDMNDCLTFMNNTRFGTWDDFRQDTVICRQYHAVLAILRPHIHCSHAGKTGGGKCIPHTAAELYHVQY
jgi:hypothetical protein